MTDQNDTIEIVDLFRRSNSEREDLAVLLRRFVRWVETSKDHIAQAETDKLYPDFLLDNPTHASVPKEVFHQKMQKVIDEHISFARTAVTDVLGDFEAGERPIGSPNRTLPDGVEGVLLMAYLEQNFGMLGAVAYSSYQEMGRGCVVVLNMLKPSIRKRGESGLALGYATKDLHEHEWSATLREYVDRYNPNREVVVDFDFPTRNVYMIVTHPHDTPPKAWQRLRKELDFKDLRTIV